MPAPPPQLLSSPVASLKAQSWDNYFLLYAGLLTIIAKNGLQGHLYADDSQVYGFCRPNSTDVQHLWSVSTSCISDIADWMKCNRLQLNSSKSEFIWCYSSSRLKHLDCNPFVIGADAIQPKNEARDIGLVLDRDLSMTSHITGLMRTSFAILRQLRSVSRSLTRDAFEVAGPRTCNYSGNQNPSCFQKTVETVLDR